MEPRSYRADSNAYCALEPGTEKRVCAVSRIQSDADIATGIEICRLLLSCFQNGLQFHIEIWPFNIFQRDHLNLDAVRGAVAADAIIVATHRHDDLPPAIKEWIKAWAPQKREQTAILIALFQSAEDSAGVPFATFDFLKKAASEAGMDFLVRQNRLDDQTPESLPGCQEATISPAPEAWGIND